MVKTGNAATRDIGARNVAIQITSLLGQFDQGRGIALNLNDCLIFADMVESVLHGNGMCSNGGAL